MKCVIYETLRMYTPAGGVFFRVANHNQKIGDLNIQKGTLVSVGFYALQYSNLN